MRFRNPFTRTDTELQAMLANDAQKASGHAWYCDCPGCAGDGGEGQWHRLGEPHWCGDAWWPGFGARQQPIAPQRLWGH